MTHASLFSGIGGPEVAAAMLGWENLFHCEINPFGSQVLGYWFPNSKHYEDVTKTNFTEWRGKVDVLTGGFPCQPFSYAGKRGGREDMRYLWPEMCRVINEVRPTWVVGENVAGITTMVEGWDLTPMGCDSSLFGEMDGIHRYGLRQTFTIERICRDLEGIGYEVQPMLIPAAAVNAPHRRDRIFFLAFDADSDLGDDLRESGVFPCSQGKKRLQERHDLRQPGEPGDVRSEVPGTVTDSDGDPGRCVSGERRKEDIPYGQEGGRIQGSTARPGRKQSLTNTKSQQGNRDGLEQPKDSREGQEQPGGGSCKDGAGKDSPNSDLQRCDECLPSEKSSGEERLPGQKDIKWRDGSLDPERRWSAFPTVSPVHRGNDGLPFSLDNLTISPRKWRDESLKAYGNAIVPQVMYRIFQMIESVSRL